MIKNKESNESPNACKITVVAIKRLKSVFPFLLLCSMPFTGFCLLLYQRVEQSG